MNSSDYLYYPQIYLGSTQLEAIYKGSEKIWPIEHPTVDVRRPLMVYEQGTRDFTGNGIGTLRPISAVWELEMRQAGSITVTHPIDKSGAWRMLTPNAIILAPCKWHGVMRPQAFRIYRTVKQMDSSGRKTITAYARHVFYDLNHSVIEKLSMYARPATAVQYCFTSQFGFAERTGALSEQSPRLNYLASDAWYDRDDSSVRNYSIQPGGTQQHIDFQSVSIAAALIGGSSSIAGLWGLEFYADNYYFSLRSQMEGSLQNSFAIRYSHDMTEVTEDLDYTNACSSLMSRATGSGYYNYIYYPVETAYGPFSRPVVANFSFSEFLKPTESDPDPEITRLLAASTEYWNDNHAPVVSYQAKYAPLKHSKSRDFLDSLDGREVGDTGTVTNTDLGITTTQRIIYKRVDLLTGITLDVKLGNPPAYLTQKSSWGDTVRTGAPSAIEKQLEELRNK